MAITSKLGTLSSYLGNVQLGGPANVDVPVSASNTASFTQSATYNIDRVVSASNTLSLTQTAVGRGTIHVTASSTLTFTQSVTVRGPIYVTAQNTIAFVSDQRTLRPQQSGSSTITFVGVATKGQDYNRVVSQSLLFLSVADATLLHIAANTITFVGVATAEVTSGVYSTVSFTQTATVQLDPHNERLFQTVAFTQQADRIMDRPRTLVSTLTFSQVATAQRWRYGIAESVLPITNAVYPVRILRPESVLELSHEATAYVIRVGIASNHLGLSQSLSRNVDYTLAAQNTISFLSGYRQISDQSGQPVTVPLVIGIVVPKVVTMQIPGLAITLPKPLLGDSEGGLGKIDLKRTDTGETYTYVRRSVARTLKYKFNITRTKVYEMRNFVFNALPIKITMVNWKGEIWYGNLTNNPFQFTAQSRTGPCGGELYEIDVEFEGIRLN